MNRDRLTLSSREGKLFLLYLSIWFVAHLAQSYLTELSPDESYYWVWSRFPDWGYYEHPPMVALLIAPGYALLGNELGVRLLFVMMTMAALVLLHRLGERKEMNLFFVMAFSVLFLEVIGENALPDVPLVFFTTIFFLGLKRYMREDDRTSIIILGCAVPLMFYSKYQGLLVVLFAILANPSFLRRKSFWLIAAISFVLFLPHFVWQASHGFPTVRLHLLERFRGEYTPLYVLTYLGGQALILGPLIGIPILYAAFRYRPVDAFERTLRITMIGFFSFFFLVSFRGKTNPQWTLPASIVAFVFAYRYVLANPGIRRVINVLSVPSMALLLLVGIHIVWPVVTFKDDPSAQLRGWRDFTHEVARLAGNLPVVTTSYQIACKLSFYGGRLVPSLNADNLSNQYEYWHFADSLRGKNILFLSPREFEHGTPLTSPMGQLLYLSPISGYDRAALKTLLR